MSILDQVKVHPRHEVFHIQRILQPESDRVPKRQHKIVAVLPAYNAESTLAATLADVPVGSVDEFILVDDGSKDRTVRLWNPANGQSLKSLEGHTAWVQGVALLAQGTRLASVGADQTVRLWDLTAPAK